MISWCFIVLFVLLINLILFRFLFRVFVLMFCVIVGVVFFCNMMDRCCGFYLLIWLVV